MERMVFLGLVLVLDHLFRVLILLHLLHLMVLLLLLLHELCDRQGPRSGLVEPEHRMDFVSRLEWRSLFLFEPYG
jgi:hypothetical protein